MRGRATATRSAIAGLTVSAERAATTITTRFRRRESRRRGRPGTRGGARPGRPKPRARRAAKVAEERGRDELAGRVGLHDREELRHHVAHLPAVRARRVGEEPRDDLRAVEQQVEARTTMTIAPPTASNAGGPQTRGRASHASTSGPCGRSSSGRRRRAGRPPYSSEREIEPRTAGRLFHMTETCAISGGSTKNAKAAPRRTAASARSRTALPRVTRRLSRALTTGLSAIAMSAAKSRISRSGRRRTHAHTAKAAAAIFRSVAHGMRRSGGGRGVERLGTIPPQETGTSLGRPRGTGVWLASCAVPGLRPGPRPAQEPVRSPGDGRPLPSRPRRGTRRCSRHASSRNPSDTRARRRP